MTTKWIFSAVLLLASLSMAGTPPPITSDGIREGTVHLFYTDGRFDTRFATKSTTNLLEGTNLYYTQARFDSAFGVKSTTNLVEGTNLYYTQARFDSAFGAKSTTNLLEGTNLYYTQARFDSAFGAKSTTNLVEGTNLYFTNARARTALSATSPLSYDNSTGVFSIPVATSSVNGYLSSADWSTFNNKEPALPLTTNGDILYQNSGRQRLPIGTAGQQLRVSSGTLPSWNDWIEPSQELRLYEDWIGDGVGTLRWLDADTGTGVSNTSLTIAEANHPGVLQLDNVSTSGTAARYLGGVTAGAATSGFIVGGGPITFEWLTRIEDLATVGDDYNLFMGLSDSATGNVNVIMITYQRSVSTNWLCKTNSASVATNTSTGVAVVADAWVKLKVVVNAAGTSVDCYVNNALVATNTTNIPSVTVAPQLRLTKSAGAASRMAYIDYFKLYSRFTTPR